MTTLSTLIAEYKKWKETFTANSKRDVAAVALANYLLSHAADYAERERLEAEIAASWKHKDDVYRFEKAERALIDFLVRHAGGDGSVTP